MKDTRNKRIKQIWMAKSNGSYIEKIKVLGKSIFNFKRKHVLHLICVWLLEVIDIWLLYHILYTFDAHSLQVNGLYSILFGMSLYAAFRLILIITRTDYDIQRVLCNKFHDVVIVRNFKEEISDMQPDTNRLNIDIPFPSIERNLLN